MFTPSLRSVKRGESEGADPPGRADAYSSDDHRPKWPMVDARSTGARRCASSVFRCRARVRPRSLGRLPPRSRAPAAVRPVSQHGPMAWQSRRRRAHHSRRWASRTKNCAAREHVDARGRHLARGPKDGKAMPAWPRPKGTSGASMGSNTDTSSFRRSAGAEQPAVMAPLGN
jgi:hypothetical protein